MVEELAGLGATVYTCSRNEAQIKECVNGWEKKGFRVSGSVCDLASESDRKDLIAKVSSLFNGQLNILVNDHFLLLLLLFCFVVLSFESYDHRLCLDKQCWHQQSETYRRVHVTGLLAPHTNQPRIRLQHVPAGTPPSQGLGLRKHRLYLVRQWRHICLQRLYLFRG